MPPSDKATDRPERNNDQENMDVNDIPNDQAEQQPAATSTQKLEAVATKAVSIRGQYFTKPNGFNISVVADDPIRQGRQIREQKQYDFVTGFVANRVSGTPRPQDGSVPTLTLHGRYDAKGGELRVTISGQEDIDAVAPVFRKKVRKDKSLTEPLVFDVAGLPMPQFGFNAYAMFHKEPTGEKKTLFMPVGANVNDTEGGSGLAEDFLESKP